MRFRFSRAWALLTATLIIGCSPEPAWPDTSILHESVPWDYRAEWVEGKKQIEVFDELYDAFFLDDSEPPWLREDHEEDYMVSALPGKTIDDLPPQVRKAIENVISWHKQQLETEPEYFTGNFSAYSEMVSAWRFEEISTLFEVCSKEKELMAAFVHAAQVVWNDGTSVVAEMYCKSAWYWLHHEPSLAQEEKNELLLRFPLRRDASYIRFRADLINWVDFWEGLTRARQREIGESPPYRNKLDYLDEAFLLVSIANHDLPLTEEERQVIRESEFWKDRFHHIEFMQEIWIPRFAMQ